MLMDSKQTRDNVIASIRLIRELCQSIVRESHHSQKVIWKGKPVIVIWRLEYDDEDIVFIPHVDVLHEDLSEALNIAEDADLLQLVVVVERGLNRMKDLEGWPDRLSTDWLELPSGWFQPVAGISNKG